MKDRYYAYCDCIYDSIAKRMYESNGSYTDRFIDDPEHGWNTVIPDSIAEAAIATWTKESDYPRFYYCAGMKRLTGLRIFDGPTANVKWWALSRWESPLEAGYHFNDYVKYELKHISIEEAREIAKADGGWLPGEEPMEKRSLDALASGDYTPLKEIISELHTSAAKNSAEIACLKTDLKVLLRQKYFHREND